MILPHSLRNCPGLIGRRSWARRGLTASSEGIYKKHVIECQAPARPVPTTTLAPRCRTTGTGVLPWCLFLILLSWRVFDLLRLRYSLNLVFPVIIYVYYFAIHHNISVKALSSVCVSMATLRRCSGRGTPVPRTADLHPKHCSGPPAMPSVLLTDSISVELGGELACVSIGVLCVCCWWNGGCVWQVLRPRLRPGGVLSSVAELMEVLARLVCVEGVLLVWLSVLGVCCWWGWMCVGCVLLLRLCVLLSCIL